MSKKENLGRVVYRKLKHLHQRKWDGYATYSGDLASANGVWRINVIVPYLNAMYIWHSESNQLQSISLEDKDNITTYQGYDFKLFIKVMKKILRRKSINLIYEKNLV